MATNLPTDIAASYPDRSGGDKAHQQHHDSVHGAVNELTDTVETGRLSEGALNNAFAGRGQAPAAVGDRGGTFDASLSLYLPVGTNLDSIKARLSDAYRKVARCRAAWIGTSIVAGYGSTPGSSDVVSQFCSLLGPRYGAVGGMPIATNGVTNIAPDSRYTMTSGWGFSGGPRVAQEGGNIQPFRRASVVGETLTFTSDTAGTVVDIYTFGNTKAFSYQIDGGAAVNVTPNGQSAVQVIAVTGLADATHSVRINVTTAGSYTYILGIDVRQATGFDVANMGYYGAVANDWSPGGQFFHGYNISNAYDPHLAIVQLGANEAIHGYAPATLNSELASIVAAHETAGRDVILAVDPPIESETVTDWETFRSEIYAVADAYGVPLVDFTHAWGSRAEGNALGYYADQWHPSPAGSEAMARKMADALTLG